MIVGDAMGGKTSAYKVLSAGLADLQTSGLMEEYKVPVHTGYVHVGPRMVLGWP